MAIHLDLLRRITDDDLLRLSARNPGYSFERSAEGRLVVSPTGGESGRRSLTVAYQLEYWNRRGGRGVTFDSSTGFNLPDGACLSPDASWVRRERWDALGTPERQGYPPLCPDAVFEVRSPTDTLAHLRLKMKAHVHNGARLAVMVDAEELAVEVDRPGREPERHRGAAGVDLGPELPGFVLDVVQVARD